MLQRKWPRRVATICSRRSRSLHQSEHLVAGSGRGKRRRPDAALIHVRALPRPSSHTLLHPSATLPPPQPRLRRALGMRRFSFSPNETHAAPCAPSLPSHPAPPTRPLGYSLSLTAAAGSVPKVVAPKPDSVKIRSKSTADRKIFPRIDQIDEFQGARANHWRGGLA
jgi:hypothetical protein